MADNGFKKSYSQQGHKTGITSLPRLPVPPLQQTVQRYLRSVKPLLTPGEFKITENLAEDFSSSGGVGEMLQKMLEERGANTDNWLADWWLNLSYLNLRLPLVVNLSPALVFSMQQFKSKSEQLEHAAKLIAATIDFHITLNEHKLPIDRMGPHELDMSQYYNVLGTCRIPGISRDVLLLPDNSNPSKHIVVAHNNHFFAVSVYGDQGEPLNQKQIVAQLQDVLSKSSHPATYPVGILTSENRDMWGKIYEVMKKDNQNCESLDVIERSLFLVCLDGPPSVAEISASNQMTGVALKMMHGGSTTSNSANRWFDKTIQFVIGPDGEVGFTYEHTPADGQPIAVIMDHIEAYCSKSEKEVTCLPAISFAQPKLLHFNVSSEVEKAILEAETNFNRLIDDLEMHCFTFSDYGKDFIKSQKLSPDSYIQMAIQYTFYRVHNEPGAHYEAASTRRFIHGRTEAIRSCSLESVHFSRTMCNKTASDSEKVASLRAAIQSHKEYVNNALGGEGVDRHLLGLKLIAIENGMDIPKLFLDVGYTRSEHMRLTTSQVAGRCHSFMCYGPLVPDGYGCCYNPRSDEIVFGTSAFNSCTQTNALKFCKSLEDSLNDMKYILLNPHDAKL